MIAGIVTMMVPVVRMPPGFTDEGLRAAVELRPANAAVARRLVVADAAVGKHVGIILAKLRLPSADDNRRVLAALACLRSDGRES